MYVKKQQTEKAREAESDGRVLLRALPALALAAFGVWQAVKIPGVKNLQISIAGLPPEFDGYHLVQITDTKAIEAIVDAVIAANPKPVEDFKGGNEKSIGFLVGQVMKQSTTAKNIIIRMWRQN